MSENNKAKIGIHMYPELIDRVNAEYPLYDFPSRSAFVSAATEFYLGYLHSQKDTEYMSKTTLSFLENQVTKLDAKICRQLFRMCVELSIPIVKYIFSLCMNGKGLSQVVKQLKQEQIPTPSHFYFQKYGVALTNYSPEKKYEWAQRHIGNMLEDEVYIGHTISLLDNFVEAEPEVAQDTTPKEVA